MSVCAKIIREERLELKMHKLAVDIGGTKIAAAVCDENDRIVEKHTVSTPADADVINGHIADLYKKTAEKFDDISAIGISAAGNVKADRRTVSFSANIPAWTDYPLSEKIEELIGNDKVSVIVENDANCAGWGEYVYGAAAGTKNMVMLTVGTGLGGAVVTDGHLFRGAFGMAAELGHLPMVPAGDICGCGLSGCAERYASGTALERFAHAALRRNPDSGKKLLDMCSGDINNLQGIMVTEAAKESDAAALEAFNMTGQWLGQTMAAISAVLDPEIFVVGGGVAAAGDLLLKPAREAYERYLQAASYRPHAKIAAASTGQDAGLIGAANLSVL